MKRFLLAFLLGAGILMAGCNPGPATTSPSPTTTPSPSSPGSSTAP